MSDTFGNSQYSLDAIGSTKAQQIAKQRAIIEAKEKGVDMAKTVGETKLFMSAHGITNALKPLKARIKKVAGRKANEFKKTIVNKVSDLIDGDGGKSRRLKEFKSKQSVVDEDESFAGVRKRFGKLGETDKEDIRSNLRENPDYMEKEDVDNLTGDVKDAQSAQNTKLLKDEVSNKETENFVKDDAEEDGGAARRLKVFNQEKEERDADPSYDAVKNRFDKLSGDDQDAIGEKLTSNPDYMDRAGIKELGSQAEKDTQQLTNRGLLKDEVSKTETKNFVENDAKTTVDNDIADQVTGIGSKIGNFAKSGKQAVSDAADKLNTAGIKKAAKKMAENTVADDGEAIAGDTVGEVAGAALDAIPFADIFGAILGGSIAIKKARQVRKLERKDESIVADAPVTGSLQQVGV